MKVIRDAWLREDFGDLKPGGVGTIGNFDGVHLGQQAILEKVAARSQELKVPAVVVTFEPHPLTVLRPKEAPPRLTTPEQKEKLLERHGVDHVVVVEFDEAVASTPGEVFARDFLFGRLGLKEIFVGSRFVFGHRRDGTLSLLKRIAGESEGVAEGLAEVLHVGSPVSSTRIRTAVRNGDTAAAGELLGRPYEITGQVVEGAGKGKELGFPTVNLTVDNELLPANGVYTSWLRLEGEEESRAAVTNIGLRPTLHNETVKTVESHILDFDGDVYGRRVELDLVLRLRSEQRFAGVVELKQQIGRDVERARGLLEVEGGE